MSLWRRFFLRLGNALRPARAEPDLARGLASHLALLEDEFRRRGMTPEEARLSARRALGGVEQAKDLHGTRDRSGGWMTRAGMCNTPRARSPVVPALPLSRS
jgi:hypothetical protein